MDSRVLGDNYACLFANVYINFRLGASQDGSSRDFHLNLQNAHWVISVFLSEERKSGELLSESSTVRNEENNNSNNNKIR